MDQKKLDKAKEEMKARLDALENVDAEQLSEEDLEEVAGGWCSLWDCSDGPAPVEQVAK